MKEHTNGLKKIFEEYFILQALEIFGNALKNQGKFYTNYMKIFEVRPLFIRASRENLWQLHHSSKSDIKKYFFAHDQLN